MPTRSPLLGERRGEVRGQRRLADAALARRDGDARACAGSSEISRSARPPRRRVESAAFSSGLITSKRSSHRRSTPATAPTCPPHLVLEASAQRAAGDGERDRHRRRARRPRRDVAHHVELGNRTLELGVDDLLERFQDVVAIRSHGRPRVAPPRCSFRSRFVDVAFEGCSSAACRTARVCALAPGGSRGPPLGREVAKVRGKVFVFFGPADRRVDRQAGRVARSRALDRRRGADRLRPRRAGWVTMPLAAERTDWRSPPRLDRGELPHRRAEAARRATLD